MLSYIVAHSNKNVKCARQVKRLVKCCTVTENIDLKTRTYKMYHGKRKIVVHWIRGYTNVDQIATNQKPTCLIFNFILLRFKKGSIVSKQSL